MTGNYRRLLLMLAITQASSCDIITSAAASASAAASGGAGANYHEQNAPYAKTNINEVTDFFPVELKDRGELDRTFIESQSTARAGIESGSSAGELERALKLEGDTKGKAAELSSIPAHDLENRGMKARHSDCSFYDESRLEVDYNEPLVAQHKNDVDHILNGCNSFLGNLLGGLKDLGIDCKTIAGNREQEPEYNVYNIPEAAKETVYDQKFCEQQHHTYSCNYTLTTFCSRPSIAYRDWQAKELRVGGAELVSAGKFVFEINHVRAKVFEYILILKPRPKRWWWVPKVQAMREFLVTKHPGATLDNIDSELDGRAEGETFSIDGWNYCGRRLGSKDYAFSTYVINYRYREGYPICLQWQDNWEEKCTVN